MNSQCIDAFLAVVRMGTLTDAANSLFISQSALSHRLTELEKEIGYRLINRRPGKRSLTLSEKGKEFYLLAKRWEELVENSRQISQSNQGTSIVIGAVDTINSYLFPPLYEMMRTKAPWLNIRIRTYNSTELYYCIDRGEVDLAFPLVEFKLHDIDVQKFMTEPRVLLRYEVNPSRATKQIGAYELQLDKEILFEGDKEYLEWHEQWRSGRSFPSICVDTPTLLLNLLNKEGAWSIVPFCLAKHFTKTGTYSMYILDNPPPNRICYKICGKQPKSSIIEALAVVEACLKEVFKENTIE